MAKSYREKLTLPTTSNAYPELYLTNIQVSARKTEKLVH